MPRGRPRQDPSPRNLELYHLFVCKGHSQRDVAAHLAISQPRIARVCRRVNAWLDAVLPLALAARVPLAPGENRLSQRFHLAIAFRHEQLTAAYEKFLSHFGGSRGALGFGCLQAANDAGLLPAELAAKLPPRDLIQSAVRFARQLDDLSSLATICPFSNKTSPLRPLSAQGTRHVPLPLPTEH